MAVIYETPNFIIKAADLPHVYVDRMEGGHMQIRPKFEVSDRTQLEPDQAVEYMKLSMVAGEALRVGMGRRGVEIGIVNYQDMGNWQVFRPQGPRMHLQIFGRAKDAVVQKYGDAVMLPHLETGFYDNFKPLNNEDITEIRTEIERLMATDKYRSF